MGRSSVNFGKECFVVCLLSYSYPSCSCLENYIGICFHYNFDLFFVSSFFKGRRLQVSFNGKLFSESVLDENFMIQCLSVRSFHPILLVKSVNLPSGI